MKKVAYQGGPGAYSMIAAKNYFGTTASIEFIGHLTFGDALDSVLQGRCDFAIIPLKNSITGFIQDYPKNFFDELGEITLEICHCLLGLEGTELSNISHVYSHPQALAQCKEFLASHPHFKPTEYTDTALAAQKISEEKDNSHAAIASAEAGNLYRLTVLARDIADKPNNKTRFVVLERKQL